MPNTMLDITVLAPGTVVAGEVVKCKADDKGKTPPGVHHQAPKEDAHLLLRLGKALIGHVDLKELDAKPPTKELAQRYNYREYFAGLKKK